MVGIFMNDNGYVVSTCFLSHNLSLLLRERDIGFPPFGSPELAFLFVTLLCGFYLAFASSPLRSNCFVFIFLLLCSLKQLVKKIQSGHRKVDIFLGPSSFPF